MVRIFIIDKDVISTNTAKWSYDWTLGYRGRSLRNPKLRYDHYVVDGLNERGDSAVYAEVMSRS